jgi:hypothetical protein
MSSAAITKHLQCIRPEDIIGLSRDTGVSSLSVTEAVAIAELVGKFTAESSSRSNLDVIGALMMNITNSVQSFTRLPTNEEVRLCCRLAHIDDEAAVTQVQYLRLFDIFKRLLAIQMAAAKQSESGEHRTSKQRELTTEVSVTVSAMCTGTPFLFRGTVLPIEVLTHLASKFGLDASKWFLAASTSTLLPTSNAVVRALEELLLQHDMDDEDMGKSTERTGSASVARPTLLSFDSGVHKHTGSRPQQLTVNYISVHMMSEMFTPVNEKLVQVFRTYFGAYDPNDPQGVFGTNDLVGGHLSLQLSLHAFRTKLGLSEKKLRQLIVAATEPLAAPSPPSSMASGPLESRRSVVMDELPPSQSFSNPVDEQSPSTDRKRPSQQTPLYDDQPSDAETIFANGFIRFPDFECIVRFLNDEQQAIDVIKADQRSAATAVINARDEELQGGAADSERLVINAQTAMIDRVLQNPVPLQPTQPAAAGKATASSDSPQAIAELPKITPSTQERSTKTTPQQTKEARLIEEPSSPKSSKPFKGSMVPRKPPGQICSVNTIFVSPNTSVQWHASSQAESGRAHGLAQQQQPQQSAVKDAPPLQLAAVPQVPPHIALRALLGRSAQSFLYEEPAAVVGGVDLRHTLVDLGAKSAPQAGAASTRSIAPDVDLLEDMELENNDSSMHSGRQRGGRRRSVQQDQGAGDDDAKVMQRSGIVDMASISAPGPAGSAESRQLADEPASATAAPAPAKEGPSATRSPLAAENPLDERPRWRNVKHIPRYDGQEICAYTAPVDRSARSPSAKSKSRRAKPQLLLPVEISQKSSVGLAEDPEDRKPSSARAPKKSPHLPEVQRLAKTHELPLIPAKTATHRPATSEEPTKPKVTHTNQQPAPVSSFLSKQPSPPTMQTHRSQTHLDLPPPVSSRGQRTYAALPVTCAFPREVGADIWNVLGVRAVPDGFPQMQYMAASNEVTTHPPRSDFNSLHSAVLSFNKYQMEAIRLR